MSLQLSTRVNGTPVLNFGSGAIPAGARVVAGCRLTEDAQIYAAVSGTVATYCQGLPFDSDGRLLAAFNSVATYSNGIPLDSSGFLCAGGVVPATWSGGLPFDSDGALAGWSPLYLFSSGANGFVNQLALGTLYTDTAGTTPVTTIGDTIALGLDQSGNSNDMVQATAAARPVYGQMPSVGVRNLFAAFDKQNVDLIAGSSWNFSPGSQYTFQGAGDPAVLTPNWGGDPNATRVQLALNGGTQGTDRSGFSTTNFNISTLTQTDFTASCRIAPHGSTTSSDLEMAAAGILCFFAASDTSQETRFRDNGDGTYTIANAVLGTVAANGNIRFQLQGSVGPDTLDFILYNDSIQLEVGVAATRAQRVTSAYDVTQPGIPSVPIAYLDTSDDNFSWTLPAGTYHLFIAGDLGCYFDTVEHAGGEFTVGPTSWAGGPDGAITTLIGQRHVIMPVIRDEAFTQSEKELMVAYVMAKGAPGVWERSANLVTNPGGPFVDTTGWIGTNDGALSVVDGNLTVTYGSNAGGGATTALSDTFAAGELALIEVAHTARTTPGNCQVRLTPGTDYVQSLPAPPSVAYAVHRVVAGVLNLSVGFGSGAPGDTSSWGMASVRKLTLNTDPYP